MHVRARAWGIPKAGNALEEYEDAFWPERAVNQEAESFRFAVADGATETSFAGLWARMLARAWCKGQLDRRRLHTSLPALQHTWLAKVQARPLPWYAEEKLRSGAFSSILGIAIGDGAGRCRWEAVAAGDSVLVQVRDGRLLSAFPLTRAEAFDNRPLLLSSNPARNRQLAEHFLRASGEWVPGDVFYLMTDALACWFLQCTESGGDSCTILGALGTEQEDRGFALLVDELRGSRAMRNDDVTLVMVTVE